jgi:PAS domain S-box-containing protein
MSLFGWISGLLIVTSIRLNYTSIAPSTALCFMVLSASLLVYARDPENVVKRAIVVVSTVVILLFSVILLIGNYFGTRFAIEYLGIKSPSTGTVYSAGHMSPITGVTFFVVTLGILFLVLTFKRERRFKQAAAFSATVVSLIGFIVLLGYTYGTPLLYGGNIIPVALPTALAFLSLGIGIISASGADVLPISMFTGPTVRSQLMRAFFPAIIIYVLIDGLLYKTELTRTGNPALKASFIALFSIIIVGVIISRIAKSIGNELDRAHSERDKAESEIRFLASIIKNLPDAVCAIDLKGIIIAWNGAAEKLLGYKAEEIINTPITVIIPEEIARKDREHFLTILNAEGGLSGYESVRLTKDGRRIPVELTGVAIKDKTQKITSYASIMVDITERKTAEGERLKSHVLESIGILAGGIAHDFNNLLTAILGNITVAKMFVTPGDKAFNRLADAEQVCLIAGQLSQQLLTFASGGNPVRKIAQLSGLIKETANAILGGSNVSFEINWPDDLYPLSVDEGQMQQVFSNLIANAKEAMKKEGRLAIRGENLHIAAQDSIPLQEGYYVKIAIHNTGAGIPEENLARVFDPYFSTKDTYNQKGLGLGLAVCYSIIKRHDGLITVGSEVGKGTTFTIYIPAFGYK